MKTMHSESKYRPFYISAEASPLQPRDNDVLCGRGSTFDEHPGNMYFRQIVKKHKTNYTKARKKGKKEIALVVLKQLEQMAPPARFLVRDTDTGDCWIEADYKTAYNKTTQTLRQIPKRKSKKISSPPPQNILSITIQGSQQNHQELHQHPEPGFQQAIGSGRNHPCVYIACSCKTDNPIHPEKQHCGNVIRSIQGPFPSPDGKQSSFFQQQPVSPESMTDLSRNTIKHVDACKNTNKSSNSTTSEDKPVPVADHPEDLQETMNTKDNTWKTFTSDEIEYLSKVFLGDNHQHTHKKQRSISSPSRTAVQDQQEHSLSHCSPKKRRRIIHEEQTTHVQKCHDVQGVNTAVTSEGTLVSENIAEYVVLLANYITGDRCSLPSQS